MSIKINLSKHADKFTTESNEFLIEKKVNFIFGKNGTGKTTIADEIVNQFSNEYDICVFKDFDGVAENARLDAVALGVENKNIQKKIDVIDVEIINIKSEISQPKADDKEATNLYTQATKTQIAFSDAENALSKFFTNSAAQIKKQTKPQITTSGYNKNNFEHDINNASLLSDDLIASHKITIAAEKKSDVSRFSFSEIDFASYLKSVNEIIQLCVEQPQNIPELKDNVDKQNFAKLGTEIHEHKSGEVCAFCGNEIKEERWQELAQYFNEEYSKLDKRITKGLSVIDAGFEAVRNVGKLNERDFYDRFIQNVENINSQLEARKNEYYHFLEFLKTTLEEKRQNMFFKSDAIIVDIPQSFDDIKQVSDDLVTKHNTLTKNLNAEQEKARDALRCHEVKKILDNYKFDKKNKELVSLKAANDYTQSLLMNRKSDLTKKLNERNNLLLQTRDEEKIANKINDRMASMGVASFSLKLVENDVENQKGQYQIKGNDDEIRPITQLSKGEKNIIAFLYFIFSLENIENNSKHRIIVFDDPMTSNDDTTQYLMIGELQNLYQNLKDGNYFILLTHNCHFYLNVRPSTMPTYKEIKKGTRKGLYEEVGLYDKYGIYHLLHDSKRSTIKNIDKYQKDFRTNYEALWKELVYLYKSDDATSDIMLNPCRRICETYLKFTKQNVMDFYSENKSAKKLFDVNQHSIDDFEAEQNGRSKEDIKTILEELFKVNNAENHFNDHWKGGEQ